MTAAETAVYYEDQGRHASQKTKLITLIQQLRPRTMSPAGLALSAINFRVGGHARLLVPFTLGRPWLMTLGLYSHALPVAPSGVGGGTAAAVYGNARARQCSIGERGRLFYDV